MASKQAMLPMLPCPDLFLRALFFVGQFENTSWEPVEINPFHPVFTVKDMFFVFFPRKIQQKRRETSLSRWRRLLRAWGKRSRSWPEFFWRKVKSVNIWVIGSQEALNHQNISMLFKLQKHLKVCKKSTSQSNLHTAPFQDSPFRPARLERLQSFLGVKLSKSRTLRIHGEKCVVQICKAPSIYGLLHHLEKEPKKKTSPKWDYLSRSRPGHRRRSTATHSCLSRGGDLHSSQLGNAAKA